MAYAPHRPDLISGKLIGGNLILQRTISGQVWTRHVGLDDYLSPMEAAVVLQVHRLTVYDWINKGLLQAYPSDYGHLLRWRDVREFGRKRDVLR